MEGLEMLARMTGAVEATAHLEFLQTVGLGVIAVILLIKA